MDWEDAVSRLEAGLHGPLPGGAAHALMAPFPRRGWEPGRVPPDAREAGCLVLLFPDRAIPRFVLTLRPMHLARHAGQVSLPGGAIEPGESVEGAALREAAEEVGADPDSIRIVGSLTPLHVPVSGFVLRPVVGVAFLRPDLEAREGEVDAILEPALADLLDPASLGEETRHLGGSEVRVPFYRLCSRKVWGATAMILSELSFVLDPSRAARGR